MNESSVAKFLHPLIVAFPPNTYQQSWIKWRTSNVLAFCLKQWFLTFTNTPNPYVVFQAFVVLWSKLLPLRYRDRFYREMPCSIHSSDGITAVLYISVLSVQLWRLLGRIAVLSEVSLSTLREKETHEHWSESITAQSTEVAYLWYLCFITLVLIAWAQFCCKMWGGSLVWNQYITKPNEKNVGDMAYYISTVRKVRGSVPRVPHLIAPMIDCNI